MTDWIGTVYSNTPAVILGHGYIGELLGKTAHGLLMHGRLFQIRAVVDRFKAGQSTSRICPGVTRDVPILVSIYEALPFCPKVVILIGTPEEYEREELLFGIEHGMDLINTSFSFLNRCPWLVSAAVDSGVRLLDLRDVQSCWREADGSILDIQAKVVYVMGTDCGLGKRTATYELTMEAKRRGIRAAFAATGQTGMMIGADAAIIYDTIPTNFAAGSVEQLITDLDREGFELIFLEGQASIMHFGYSASIGLLHASNPHAIILVHDPERTMHAAMPNRSIYKMNPIRDEIDLIHRLSLPGGNTYRVVGMATIGRHNVRRLQADLGLPSADVRQDQGPAVLLDALLDHLASTYHWQPANQDQHHAD